MTQPTLDARMVNVSQAGGGVTMRRIAKMDLMRRTARWRNSECVQKRKDPVSMGSVFMNTSGVMAELTVRTALMRSSAMSIVLRTCSSATSLPTASTRSGSVTGRGTAVMGVMRPTVPAEDVSQASSGAPVETRSASTPSGSVTMSLTARTPATRTRSCVPRRCANPTDSGVTTTPA